METTPMLQCFSRRSFLAGLLFVLAASRPVDADTFTYVDRDGQRKTVEARLYASDSDVLVLEQADGSLTMVPNQVVMKRTAGDDPEPITPAQMLERLKEEFTEELFRGVVSGQYVIGVILQSPLPKTSERRVASSLRKSATYMRSVERSFTSFVKRMKVQPETPKYPLVVLIFETDEDFEEYTQKNAGGGLSAGRIAGFYSQLTNHLYVRMSECYTFGTPLHEAIHQQCFNTGVLQRLASIPVWFAEGIATGFEGSGDRVKSDPTKLALEYAKQIADRGPVRGLTWQNVVTEDGMFRGDIFAGVAYVQAWAMHWYLVTNHPRQYGSYLKYMQSLPPLTEVGTRTRVAKFEEHFEESAAVLERRFPEKIRQALKKVRFPSDPEDKPGVVSRNLNLAGIHLLGETNGRQLNVQGKLRNISPIREMSYYVTVSTPGGLYTDYYIPKLRINQVYGLSPQLVNKRIAGARGGPGNYRGFALRVLSAPADSPTAKAWAEGKLPVPKFAPPGRRR